MGQKCGKSVKHPPPAPSFEKEEDTSGGAEDSSPEQEAPKTLTPTPKSPPAKPQPSNTKTPIPTPKSPPAKRQPSNTKTPIPTPTPTPTQNNDSGSSEAAGILVGKKPFQRIWSNGDEVAVLEGMIEHKMKTGKDPVADINAFSDFIMGKLDSQFSLSQLKDKIQKMKKKLRKQCSNGENMTFANAQQQKLYDLSKSYWGIAGGGRGKRKIDDVEDDLGIVEAKRAKYDAGFLAEWKKLQRDELNLCRRKLALLKGVCVQPTFFNM